MVRYMIKFEANAVGHFNDFRRWVDVSHAGAVITKIIDVSSPEELREQIMKTGNEFHALHECQIAVTTLRLTDIPQDMVKKYAYAISSTEWEWVKEWVKEVPAN